MEINALRNSLATNLFKTNEKVSSGYNSFDTVLSKMSIGRENINDRSLNDTEEISNESQGKLEDTKDNYNKDLQPITKEAKDVLKEAGVPNEDLDKIKDLKDLKDYLKEKMLKGQSKEGSNVNGILAILAALMNGTFDKDVFSKIDKDVNSKIQELLNDYSKNVNDLKSANKDLNNVLNSFKEGVKSIIDSRLKDLVSVGQNLNIPSGTMDKLLEELKQQISSNVISKLNTIKGDNSLLSIQKELISALNDSMKNLKENKDSSQNFLNSLKTAAKNVNLQGMEQKVDNNSSKSSDSFTSNEKEPKSEDDFLKNLLSSSNDKISKVTSFMSQFNNININTGDIEDLQKLVVNKNNFSSDMIKTLRYMETNNLKDLTVKISPKELGEVVIKLTMEGGAMKASITASNKEAYNLLNSNLSDITNKLQNSEIKIQNLSLNVYNEDTTFFKDGSQRQSNNNQQSGKRNQAIASISEEDDVLDNGDIINSNVDILA